MQPLCIEDEVELSIYDEDNYTSICPFKDTNHLKDEYIQDDLTGAYFEDQPLTIDHLSKYELCEMHEPFNLILDNHVKRRTN